MRYRGQAHELRVTITEPAADAIADAFHTAHERAYGFATRERAVELVALRCRAQGAPRPLPNLSHEETPKPGEPQPITLAGGVDALRLSRASLPPDATLDGPAVITQADATTYLPQGWRARVDSAGNLVVTPT